MAGVAVPVALLAPDAGDHDPLRRPRLRHPAHGARGDRAADPPTRRGRPRRTLAGVLRAGRRRRVLRARHRGPLRRRSDCSAFAGADVPSSRSLFAAALAAAVVAPSPSSLLHKERADAEAVRLATMDPLTGDATTAAPSTRSPSASCRARAAPGQPLSIIMLDIDHFRAVNEKHGTPRGRRSVLQRLADVVRGGAAQGRHAGALRRRGVPGAASRRAGTGRGGGGGPHPQGGRGRAASHARARPLAITVSVGVAARLDEGPKSIDTPPRARRGGARARQAARPQPRGGPFARTLDRRVRTPPSPARTRCSTSSTSPIRSARGATASGPSSRGSSSATRARGSTS